MKIDLGLITFDGGTQIRAAINEAVVAEYADRMTDGVQFPPIVLFADGTCREDSTPIYFIADGFHRAQAALRNKFKDIDAEVRPGTRQDALWFALGANKANGQRLTEADKKHAIVLAVATWADRPAGEIADQIGCSRSWVSEVRARQDSATGNVTRVIGRDGKSYPAARPSLEVPVGPPVTEEPKFKSRAAVAQRRQDLRDLAERGYTTRQIAATLKIGEESVASIAAKEGIRVHADRVVGKTKRHDATRIVERMVADADNLTADVGLIDFKALDHACMSRWINSLGASQKSLATFVRRLKQEQQKHGEAA